MKKISTFALEESQVLFGRYKIVELLGEGWEGQVYKVKELNTGIERAAKFFYPQRDIKGKTSNFYAKKLHKLRHCSMVIQYNSQETFFVEGHPVKVLISEFIEGELLKDFLKRQPGQRLNAFAALHFLHSLAKGIEEIHRIKEYHGDLHLENIIVQRVGLTFELKILDLYHWGAPTGAHIQDDVVDMIKIFYEVLGGKKHYQKQPDEIKDICCGLKRSLILQKFRTAGQLREYLENMEWE